MKKREQIISVAKKTIETESEAIKYLATLIDQSFTDAVEYIYNSNGRVIITGIGKSAIIANKIVATLNSTGTPAIFMHAADAIHGDLLQKERDKVMRAFKNKSVQILVATDVAARGIDIEALSYVVHYQLPENEEYYTHRSGRTARAGKEGTSIAIITPNEVKQIRKYEKYLSISFREIKAR